MVEVTSSSFAVSQYFEPSIVDYVISSNETHVVLQPNGTGLYEKSQEIYSVMEKLVVGLNGVQCTIMLVGFVLNVFVAGVLLLDKTKTSSDCYLISICFGDITICVGTLITSQLIKYYPYVLLQAVGNIIGYLG